MMNCSRLTRDPTPKAQQEKKIKSGQVKGKCTLAFWGQHAMTARHLKWQQLRKKKKKSAGLKGCEMKTSCKSCSMWDLLTFTARYNVTKPGFLAMVKIIFCTWKGKPKPPSGIYTTVSYFQFQYVGSAWRGISPSASPPHDTSSIYHS